MFKKVDCKKHLENSVKENPEMKAFVDVAKKKYELIKELVTLRKSLGLTQKDVANKSGLTQQMVSRIENFDNSPTLDNLILYIDAIGGKININI